MLVVFSAGNYSGINIGPRDSGSGAANFLLGYAPAFVSRGTPGTPPFLSNKEISFFGQDDWKVNESSNAQPRYALGPFHRSPLNASTASQITTRLTTRSHERAKTHPAGATSSTAIGTTSALPQASPGAALRNDKSVVIRGGYALKYSVDTPGIPGILQSNPPSGNSYSCSLNQYGTAACPQLPANFSLDNGIPFPIVNNTIPPGQTFAAPAGAQSRLCQSGHQQRDVSSVQPDGAVGIPAELACRGWLCRQSRSQPAGVKKHWQLTVAASPVRAR